MAIRPCVVSGVRRECGSLSCSFWLVEDCITSEIFSANGVGWLQVEPTPGHSTLSRHACVPWHNKSHHAPYLLTTDWLHFSLCVRVDCAVEIESPHTVVFLPCTICRAFLSVVGTVCFLWCKLICMQDSCNSQQMCIFIWLCTAWDSLTEYKYDPFKQTFLLHTKMMMNAKPNWAQPVFLWCRAQFPINSLVSGSFVLLWKTLLLIRNMEMSNAPQRDCKCCCCTFKNFPILTCLKPIQLAQGLSQLSKTSCR